MHILLALLTLTAPDPRNLEQAIQRGLEDVYHLRFAQADACFDSLIVAHPEHPAGYYFKATSCFYQIISSSNPAVTEKVFMEWNDRTVDVADRHPDPVVGFFYRGTAYGNIARYHVVNGDFIRAFYYARKSKGQHEEIVKIDPTLHDAYLTIGVYNYYASALPQWMGLVAGFLGLGGDRAKGIEQLETAFRKGRLSHIESQLLLANVYYEEGDFEHSLEFYTELIRLYPDNSFFYNQKGVVLFSMERFQEAERLFKEADRRAPGGLPASRLFSTYYLGRISKLKNDYESATAYFKEALTLSGRQRLFKSINAWLPASAAYQCGESYELAGRRGEAEKMYKTAKTHEHASKSIQQAATNRLTHTLSDFEKEVMQARHLVLYGKTDDGLRKMESLKKRAQGDYARFLSQIDYYSGRVLFVNGRFSEAAVLFERAVRESTPDEDWRKPSAQFYAAQCYFNLNDSTAARRAFHEVLKSDGYGNSARLKFVSRRFLSRL